MTNLERKAGAFVVLVMYLENSKGERWPREEKERGPRRLAPFTFTKRALKNYTGACYADRYSRCTHPPEMACGLAF